MSVTPCELAVLDEMRFPEVTPPTFENMKDVDDAFTGVQLNVKTVPVSPANVSIVPFVVDVNARSGSVVASLNVAVIGDESPWTPIPEIVTPCVESAVLDDVNVSAVAPSTFVNEKDVDEAVAGVQLYVNTFPDPTSESMAPFDADVNSTVGSCVVIAKRRRHRRFVPHDSCSCDRHCLCDERCL